MDDPDHYRKVEDFPVQTHPERLLDAARILELANKAYFLYVKQDYAEKANS